VVFVMIRWNELSFGNTAVGGCGCYEFGRNCLAGCNVMGGTYVFFFFPLILVSI